MQRKKLTLLPRSEHPQEHSPTVDEAKTKSNPFGAAKPVDTDSVLKKIEEKLAKEKEHKEELSVKATASNPSQSYTNHPRHEKGRSNPKQLLRRSPANPSQAGGSSETDATAAAKAEIQEDSISEGSKGSWRKPDNAPENSLPDEPGWETVPARGKKVNGVGQRH